MQMGISNVGNKTALMFCEFCFPQSLVSEFSRCGHEALVGKNTNFRRCCNWENAQVGPFLSVIAQQGKDKSKKKAEEVTAEGRWTEITSREMWLQAIRL